MKRTALTDKVACLGIDGMDPKLTRKYVDMGIMPNTKKIIEHGACREDLVLLGAMPTVTPPQWTTLATGAYPETHGITGFFRQGGALDLIDLNFSSENCWAEQIWNVTAEAGKKTLVWHWPGSAWPPSSDSPNLHVVDGTSPGSVNMSTAQIDSEYLVIASPNNVRATFRTKASSSSEVPCVVTGLDEADEEPMDKGSGVSALTSRKTGIGFQQYVMDPYKDGQGDYINLPVDAALSPISDADEKWAAAPAGAKEFVLLYSYGLVRRPALILKNEQGIYDRVAIYKNKKETEPMVVLEKDVYVRNVIDDAIKKDNPIKANRDMRILELKEDGSYLKMWVSASMDISMHMMWHPQSLYEDIVNNIGYPPPTSTLGGGDKVLITKCMNACWDHTCDWQSDSLTYLMENRDYEVVFSHFHAPDLQKHMFIREMKTGRPNLAPEEYEVFMQDVYRQVDRYLGKFVRFMDMGWTLLIMSDHAQVCPTYGLRGLGDTGLNVSLLQELGYTVLQKDEEGNDIKQVDWSKTKAVANREMYIYLNIKGRNPEGIVDPADQYQLEEEIITALYGYKDKVSGQRIVALALRRKDAALIGLGTPYPQGGDIVYCVAEGYEHDHDDSMSTSLGECDTSVSPVFFGAGPGLKEGFYTDRVIRQVDFAPTVAALLGVRYPAQCEGAPAYQILTEEV